MELQRRIPDYYVLVIDGIADIIDIALSKISFITDHKIPMG
jgi:hypothetical protein